MQTHLPPLFLMNESDVFSVSSGPISYYTETEPEDVGRKSRRLTAWNITQPTYMGDWLRNNLQRTYFWFFIFKSNTNCAGLIVLLHHYTSKCSMP